MRAAFEACIRAGGVVLFPADTVYGLACDPENRVAVERLYRLKRLLLPDCARVVHDRSNSGRSSSRARGAKWRSTSASLMTARADGCQSGAWSLSMITDRMPS